MKMGTSRHDGWTCMLEEDYIAMNTENFVQTQQKLHEIYFKRNLLPLSKIYDVVGAIEGVKPVSRVVTNEANFETLQQLFEPIMDVHIARSPFKLLVQAQSNTSGTFLTQVNADDPDAEDIYVYVSRDRTKMEALIQLDVLEKDPHQQIGHLLGYPKCCMDSYYRSIVGAADRLYVEIENTPIQKSYYFYNNRLCSLFRQHSPVSDMYPCSFACPNSAKLARACLEAVTRYFPQFSVEVITLIKKPILIINQFAFQFLSFSVDSDGLQYNPGEMSTPGIPQEFAQIVRSNNKILFASDKLQFCRDHICTEEISIKKNPPKEEGARLFIFDTDL